MFVCLAKTQEGLDQFLNFDLEIFMKFRLLVKSADYFVIKMYINLY